MAAEWGPRGVRSNAICPGMIRTALSAKFYEEPASRRHAPPSRRAGASASRSTSPNPALFLASERSRYLNGAEIVVDGGLGCMLMDMVPRPGFNDSRAAA